MPASEIGFTMKVFQAFESPVFNTLDVIGDGNRRDAITTKESFHGDGFQAAAKGNSVDGFAIGEGINTNALEAVGEGHISKLFAGIESTIADAGHTLGNRNCCDASRRIAESIHTNIGHVEGLHKKS